jgi:hypothetical protein
MATSWPTGLKLARTGCNAQLDAFYQHHPPARLFRASRADVLAWIKARFAGKLAPGNCAPPP